MSQPTFMVTSPEMADFMNKALDMLRRGESIEGFAAKHKAEWKLQEEEFRRRAAAASKLRGTEPAAVLPFFNPNAPVDQE